MIVKTAHTVFRKLTACKTAFMTYRSFAAVVLLLFIPASVFGLAAAGETVAHRKKAKIVYAAGEGDAVVITEGRITAEHGQSIRLLPGTHLKGEQPVKASIVSRERHQALAYQAKQKRQQEFLSSLFKQLKESKPSGEDVKIAGRHFPIPGGGATLGQQLFYAAALPVQTTTSFTAATIVLNKQTTLKNIHNLQVTAFKNYYLPLASWGNQPANIKVMLC